MKPGCFYSILFFVLLTVLVFSGCRQVVGKCTYGETPAQHGTVTIKLIEKKTVNNKPRYRIAVEGLFKRDFIYSGEDFEKCFRSGGFKTGSELEGSIISGGPCPPMYRLSICEGR